MHTSGSLSCHTPSVNPQATERQCVVDKPVWTGVLIELATIDSKPVDKEFTEFVNAGKKGLELLPELRGAELLYEAGVLAADHGDAG